MKVPYSQGKTITRNMIPLAVFRINQETKSKYNRKSGGTERFPLNEVSEYRYFAIRHLGTCHICLNHPPGGLTWQLMSTLALLSVLSGAGSQGCLPFCSLMPFHLPSSVAPWHQPPLPSQPSNRKCIPGKEAHTWGVIRQSFFYHRRGPRKLLQH